MQGGSNYVAGSVFGDSLRHENIFKRSCNKAVIKKIDIVFVVLQVGQHILEFGGVLIWQTVRNFRT